MNPVAVLLLHQRQQRRSSASLSMWPAIPEPCRHRNIASSAGPWRRGHATPHKRLSCLVFHNELHELDELSPLEKVLNHGLHGLHEFFILHFCETHSQTQYYNVLQAQSPNLKILRQKRTKKYSSARWTRKTPCTFERKAQGAVVPKRSDWKRCKKSITSPSRSSVRVHYVFSASCVS